MSTADLGTRSQPALGEEEEEEECFSPATPVKMTQRVFIFAFGEREGVELEGRKYHELSVLSGEART